MFRPMTIPAGKRLSPIGLGVIRATSVGAAVINVAVVVTSVGAAAINVAVVVTSVVVVVTSVAVVAINVAAAAWYRAKAVPRPYRPMGR